MSYNIAFVREQGLTFTVVCVKESVMNSSSESQKVWAAFEAQYGAPTAIVGEQLRKVYGDKRIVPWLSSIDLRRLPWRRAA